MAAAGDGLGLTFNKTHNKAERVRRILAAQLDADLSQSSVSTVASSSESVPANPAFEELLEDGDSSEPPSSLSADARGGSRPGAGRPVGMTNEKAAMNRLSEQPHPFVRSCLQTLFASWAVKTGCPAVCLTQEEAFALALAYTRVGDYLGVTDRIPIWLELAVTTVWTTANIVQSKAKIARDFRAAASPAEPETAAA